MHSSLERTSLSNARKSKKPLERTPSSYDSLDDFAKIDTQRMAHDNHKMNEAGALVPSKLKVIPPFTRLNFQSCIRLSLFVTDDGTSFNRLCESLKIILEPGSRVSDPCSIAI
uniref:Uncharacterized protein n=1 Tax=Nelumbo nucifera TaxID=4432 RepID=A0A822ZMJ3_NELNU|nr:TPA_asm: hypothetical protein HUJ06_001228 [Nelumbo nucifera]